MSLAVEPGPDKATPTARARRWYNLADYWIWCQGMEILLMSRAKNMRRSSLIKKKPLKIKKQDAACIMKYCDKKYDA